VDTPIPKHFLCIPKWIGLDRKIAGTDPAIFPEEDAEKLTTVGKVIPRRHWHVISCLTVNNFVQTEILTSFKGPKTLKNYRCTRPVPFPAASASTSETVTRLKSCSIECFRQDAATAKSIEA